MYPDADVMLRRLLLCVLIGLCAGCIPAQVPPQLAFTPGAPVRITDDILETSTFTIHIPVDWRVVTSPAENPPSVIFVAPDDQSLIFITADPDAQAPEFSGTGSAEMQRHELNRNGVYGVMISENETDLDLFTQLMNSAALK